MIIETLDSYERNNSIQSPFSFWRTLENRRLIDMALVAQKIGGGLARLELLHTFVTASR